MDPNKLKTAIDVLGKMRTQSLADAEALGNALSFIKRKAIELEAIPVIRCRDCKHWIPGKVTEDNPIVFSHCNRFGNSLGRFADDYCSAGEKKKDVQ